MPFPSLPREGLTLEFLFAPFKFTVFEPFVTGPILYGLLRYPHLLPHHIASYSDSATFILGLKILFALNVLRKGNNLLSHYALNNFKNDKTWDWKKEIAVVTGGSYGIGELLAQRLAEKSIQVIVLARTAPKKQLPANAFFYATDLRSSTSIHEVAAKIRKVHGDPTVLINNAGVTASKLILDETEEELNQTFAVNIISHFLLVKEFLPSMIEHNHGHIVTVASISSFIPHAQNVDYACTKAAELAFHEGLTQELKARYKAPKVRTSIFHPSWIRTPMIEQVLKNPTFKSFVLEPGTVVDAIVSQVLSGNSGQVILPSRFGIVSLLRGFPSWYQEIARGGIANDFTTGERAS